jgi:predicted AAA+ superfamily ATPase
MIDRGRKLENAVYLHHRRQREDLAYVAGPGEIDLVVGQPTAEAWINTAWSLADEDTWRRESGALQAKGAPARRFLVARETAGRQPPAGVKLVEAWRYLLGETN